MNDVLGQPVVVGDRVAIAKRAGNIAEFDFGIVEVIDADSKSFKIRRSDGKVSAWMQWYYHHIPSPKFCKVLRLDT